MGSPTTASPSWPARNCSSIMASVPVMFIGVFIGLFLTGQRISMMSLLGIVMLEGIVVNNAIVLIDYIQQLREKLNQKNVYYMNPAFDM